jgi:hypothetical protein
MTLSWIQPIITAAKQNAPKEFFGQIEINLAGGRIINVNIKQSIKEDKR